MLLIRMSPTLQEAVAAHGPAGWTQGQPWLLCQLFHHWVAGAGLPLPPNHHPGAGFDSTHLGPHQAQVVSVQLSLEPPIGTSLDKACQLNPAAIMKCPFLPLTVLAKSALLIDSSCPWVHVLCGKLSLSRATFDFSVSLYMRWVSCKQLGFIKSQPDLTVFAF